MPKIKAYKGNGAVIPVEDAKELKQLDPSVKFYEFA
jgi:hypothetical protein